MTEAIMETHLDHALTVGFSTGLLIDGVVAISALFVALIATWTPGRWRLQSAVHDREPWCDEDLGTCVMASATAE
jgi:hypothetical protein